MLARPGARIARPSLLLVPSWPYARVCLSVPVSHISPHQQYFVQKERALCGHEADFALSVAGTAHGAGGGDNVWRFGRASARWQARDGARRWAVRGTAYGIGDERPGMVAQTANNITGQTTAHSVGGERRRMVSDRARNRRRGQRRAARDNAAPGRASW
eukprot:594853-Pleurochrysis_carterae.AAC.7